MRFSQRIGKKSVRQSLQIESIDTPLENKLWNCFLNEFLEAIKIIELFRSSTSAKVYNVLWEDFFEQRTDEIPSYPRGDINISSMINYFKVSFFESEWNEKYDFIEFLSEFENSLKKSKSQYGNSYRDLSFTEKCNAILERENSGYRLVNNQIVQITSEHEIATIEEAIQNSSSLKPVETHLQTALEFLSNRENPDYRNSIKESISAVESFCKIITDDPKATLGTALSKIEKSHQLHGALKSSFLALYGYTSDSGGIRHALLQDDIPVSMEDAKFMLVSCSAFINYLKTKAIT